MVGHPQVEELVGHPQVDCGTWVAVKQIRKLPGQVLSYWYLTLTFSRSHCPLGRGVLPEFGKLRLWTF